MVQHLQISSALLRIYLFVKIIQIPQDQVGLGRNTDAYPGGQELLQQCAGASVFLLQRLICIPVRNILLPFFSINPFISWRPLLTSLYLVVNCSQNIRPLCGTMANI